MGKCEEKLRLYLAEWMTNLSHVKIGISENSNSSISQIHSKSTQKWMYLSVCFGHLQYQNVKVKVVIK